MHEPLEPHPNSPAAAGPTGHTGVDAALGRLAETERLPVSGHLEVYEDVHRALRETLEALDRQPGPPAPAAAPRPAGS
ncbi:hypothetical protein [Streptomyces sp. 7-21]|uniref:hypothetical protein n=1 Tax=Streptomyces sp. 7-21 TaxID=2802283 RepID=UPI00191FA392|nr:hypothetical protein [Streptomyces sp. 7-21]MBL1068894.1 hypothetical protein [Streptomyces sp. 7-21]